MGKFIDLTGQTFGDLEVIERAENYTPPGVGSKGQAMWLCRCHRCGGTVTVVGQSLRRGESTSCCGSVFQTKEIVSYSGAHQRVRAAYGKASEHLCVACGEAAEQWAYDHLDYDELTETVKAWGGKEITVAYSLKPEHFQPMCRADHALLDAYDSVFGRGRELAPCA